MKSVFAALVLMSCLVQAQSFNHKDVLNISSAKFAAKHFDATFDEGTVTINGGEQTVTIKATGHKFAKCPAGMMCVLGAKSQTFEITLPITFQEKTGCGDTIIAQIDGRPVDGILQKIEITDYREMQCRMMAPADAVLTLTTGGPNRLEGKETYVESTLELEQSTVGGRAFAFTEGELTKGFSGMETPIFGELILTQDKAILNVQIGLDCTGICPAYMPNPVRVQLPIVSVKKSGCGDVYVAKRVMYRAHMGSRTELMEITDYSNAMCEKYIKNLVEVKYSLRDDSGLVHHRFLIEQEASFSFNPKN